MELTFLKWYRTKLLRNLLCFVHIMLNMSGGDERLFHRIRIPVMINVLRFPERSYFDRAYFRQVRPPSSLHYDHLVQWLNLVCDDIQFRDCTGYISTQLQLTKLCDTQAFTVTYIKARRPRNGRNLQ